DHVDQLLCGHGARQQLLEGSNRGSEKRYIDGSPASWCGTAFKSSVRLQHSYARGWHFLDWHRHATQHPRQGHCLPWHNNWLCRNPSGRWLILHQCSKQRHHCRILLDNFVGLHRGVPVLPPRNYCRHFNSSCTLELRHLSVASTNVKWSLT